MSALDNEGDDVPLAPSGGGESAAETPDDPRDLELFEEVVRSELSHRRNGTRSETDGTLDPEIAQKRQDLEIVKRARVVEMTPEHLGMMEALYGESVVSQKALRAYRDGDRDTFDDAAQNGILVWNFREKAVLQGGQDADLPTVADQIHTDLTREPLPGAGQYFGRCLMDGDRILAWNTWTQTVPAQTSEKSSVNLYSEGSFRQHLMHYLASGVQGNVIYRGGERNEARRLQFIQTLGNIDDCVLFDTIVSNHRYAAQRLLIESLKEMLMINPNARYLLLYVLGWIDAPHMDSPLQIGKNVPSHRFFDQRGMQGYADDYSPQGPRSAKIVDGGRVFLLPGWEQKIGIIETMHCKSKKIWGKTHRDLRLEPPTE